MVSSGHWLLQLVRDSAACNLAIVNQQISGPLLGGAFAKGNYRWLFYMNLPISAVVMAIVGLFMNLKTPPGTMKQKLWRMDW